MEELREDASIRQKVERCSACPICGSVSRKKIYEALEDNLFFCAPGEWDLFRCTECDAGYLDPRLDEGSIHIAYQQYYTHAGKGNRGLLSYIRTSLANGYRNYRFGTKARPAFALGILVAFAFPSLRRSLEGQMRHLPRIEGPRALLDVGFGGADFLSHAKDAGWNVVGIDQDKKAVELAKSRGLNVKCEDVKSLLGVGEKFDVITVSHVLEHVHRPLELLMHCKKLLKEGGLLWIEVPNFDSIGHSTFASNWMGIDAPRHLVHFNERSLKMSLALAGFHDVRVAPYRPLCKTVFAQSTSISKGLGIGSSRPILFSLRQYWKAASAERVARRNPHLREYCTFIARVGSESE